jgi:integrase
VFRIQVGLGLRPGELPTLKRADFADDQSTVTLSPLLHLTLKTGSRTIQVPEVLRPMIRSRLRKKGILFSQPDGNPWESRDAFNAAYRTELRAAAKSVGIEMKIDSYIGRRTCGSILLRKGYSVESVAAILGISPSIVREHYAAILSHEVDPSPAAIVQ